MKFFKCNICGNLVELIQNGGGKLVCCGQPMEELIAKTSDEGSEKHVPVVTYENGLVTVKVGSIEHPMTMEHYITMIAISYNGKVQRKDLKYTDKPEATFEVSDFNEMEVYEYCNVHGLWKSVYKK
jgi:superoxide reductase